MSKLSVEWEKLTSEYQGGTLSVSDLLQRLGPRGAAFMSFFLSLPFLLWVAIPGFSVIFGLFILLAGIRLTFQKGVWVPKWLGNKQISGDKLIRLSNKLQKGLKWFEKGVKPRLSWMIGQRPLQCLTGLLLAFNGFLLSLPLLPGTNFTPALATALLSVGILEEDGLFVLLGYVVTVLNIALFILLPIFGIKKLF